MSADKRSLPSTSRTQNSSKSRADDSSDAADTGTKSVRGAGAAAVIVVLVLLIAPLFYVLSIGPVIWLHTHQYVHIGPDSWVAKFYAPLEFVHSEMPLLAKPLDWYVELWQADPPPPQVVPSIQGVPPSAAPSGPAPGTVPTVPDAAAPANCTEPGSTEADPP